MCLRTTKIFTSALLVLFLLVISVYGGELQRLPDPRGKPIKESFSPTGLAWDFLLAGSSLVATELSQADCNEDGLFPVTGTCRHFYFCEDLTGEKLTWSISLFTCPQDSVFDVDSKKCTSAPAVTSRYKCRNEEGGGGTSVSDTKPLSGGTLGSIFEDNKQFLERRKRATGVTNLSQNSRYTCEAIRNVDTYIRYLKSKHPLSLTYIQDESYKKIFRDYNNDLDKAKKNCNAWRSQNGVIDKLFATYRLTKTFGPNLNIWFQELQRRLQYISNQKQPDILKIEEDIKRLKETIQVTKEALTVVTAENVDQTVLTFLKNQLKINEEELSHLIINDKRSKVLQQLQELIKLSEHIKTNANGIRSEALGAKSKMEVFLNTISADAGAFRRHSTVAQDGVSNLQRQRVSNTNEKILNEREIEKKTREIREGDSEISKTKRKINNARSELASLKEKIASARHDAQTRIDVGGPLLIIPIIGWIVGGALLGTGIRDENALVAQKRETQKYYDGLVQYYNSQIDFKNGEINSAKSRINSLVARSQIIERELLAFGTLNRDLYYVYDNVNSIMPFLNKAITSVTHVHDVFISIEIDLDELIEQAERVTTAAEAIDINSLIYFTIDDMRANWDDSSTEILALADCV